MKPILSKIVNEDFGYISEETLPGFAAECPDMPVVIKFGLSPRIQVPAKEVAAKIECAMKNGDYVREVFLSAQTLDILKMAEIGG